MKQNSIRLGMLVYFLVLFILTICGVYAETDATDGDTSNDYGIQETINEVITWGVGLSGAASLIACESVKNTTPSPTSYYVFNAAAVAHLAIEKLVDDANKEENQKTIDSEYNGSNDEQNNSYAKSRDLALLNAKDAKKKGKYKATAAAAMLASAALAYGEKTAYDGQVTALENQAKNPVLCTGEQLELAKRVSVDFLTTKRCKNLGGAKVICSAGDNKKLQDLTTNCINNAKGLYTDVANSCTTAITSPCAACTTSATTHLEVVRGSEYGSSGTETETGTDEFNGKNFDQGGITQVENAAQGTDLSGIDKSGFLIDNPVTKLLTLGGWQYSPGKRAIAYGVLGVIVGANALASNVAAKKFEDEAEYYAKLASGQESCSGDNCHTDDSGSDGDTGSDSDSDGTCAESTPTIDEISFEGCEGKVKEWPQAATLSASVTSSHVNLSYDKKNSWPTVEKVGIGVVANAFVIYNRDCKWYGRTFEWMTPGQTNKLTKNFEEMFGIKHGERLGFMVSGTIRGCTSANVKERSNIIMTKFP